MFTDAAGVFFDAAADIKWWREVGRLQILALSEHSKCYIIWRPSSGFSSLRNRRVPCEVPSPLLLVCARPFCCNRNTNVAKLERTNAAI